MDYQETIEIIQYASAFNSENSRLTKALNTAISAMQELQEYKHIGTLEEVQEAVEKQKAAHPLEMLGVFDEKEYECINCGNTVPHMDKYCKWCGKKQDWRYV